MFSIYRHSLPPGPKRSGFSDRISSFWSGFSCPNFSSMENFNKTIWAAGKLFWYWQRYFLSLTRKFSGWKLKQKDFFTVYAILLLLVLFLLFSDEIHYIFVSYVNTWFRLNKLDNISRLNRNVYINIIGLYENITVICNTTNFKHGFIQKKNMLWLRKINAFQLCSCR